MRVKEAIKMLEKLNPDLGLFICLNIDTESFINNRNISQQSIITIDGLIDCSSYVGVVPSVILEVKDYKK